MTTDFKKLLSEAALYRFFSLCFQYPRKGLSDEMLAVRGETGNNELPLPPSDETLEDEYHYILGSGGCCSPCESEHSGDRLGGKGRIMADVAGFYRAFGFIPDIETKSPVDDIAVELSFLSFSTFKEAYARYQGKEEEAGLCAEAKRKFMKEHLLIWIGSFSGKLKESAPESFYAKISVTLKDSI
ncbi:MAG: molecular chaperone TorD family protein [Deltaproteobacteria bacterium]|nr:molecular chaperone TorD family protein [Deltaproteobacteria bacterium]